MKNVLILGATGSVARHAVDLFLTETDAQLTLYVRNARRLKNVDPSRARVIEGDVLDAARLKEAMTGQDVVYGNLAGDLERMARSVVRAMGSVVSRRSVAALVVKLAQSPHLEARHSLGVSKPE